MTIGLTIGKFYPFHKGHDFLIREAKTQVEHLIVLLGYKPEQAISGETRKKWIETLHPDVEVILALEDIPNENDVWAKRSLELLAGRQADIVFTSEDYGEEWAALMNARHIMIDRERQQFAISGTDLRANLKQHWDMLTPPAKAYFAKRVACVGVESSGTSTLTQALAQHYQTVWIPEYGRWYWEGRRYTPNMEEWETYEFVTIAKRQTQWEDDLAMSANRLIICDTDALATHIWHRRYVGHYAKEVEAVADSREYDLYLLTEPDFPFVQDGTREGEHIRMDMHQWFIEELERKGHTYLRLGDTHEARMAKAIEAIDKILTFPPLDAP